MSHASDVGFVALVATWWAMMAAMMLPVTWPWLRTLRRLTSGPDGSAGLASVVAPAFVAGYLGMWLAFSVGAAALQRGLATWGVVDARGVAPAVLAALLLAAAGAWQLTPAKDACLRACRSPVAAVLARWPLDGRGAARLGLDHGLACLGCCWALMLLGLAAGTAGWAWMAGLTALVAAEKVLPRGRTVARAAGGALLAAAVVTLAACGGEGGDPGTGARPGDPRSDAGPLLQPANFQETAPPRYRARFQTTEGSFVVEVHRAWAPRAADRFYNLVRSGWYDGVRFHRVLEGFVAEWGIHGDPWVNAAWRQAQMRDDSVAVANTRGRVAFSQHGPGTRTTQVFVSLGDNTSLDTQGFAPFGEVVEGMEVVDALHAGYGDGPPRGERGVYQAMAIARGDAYLDGFPELDRIERARVVGDPDPDDG